tara:strand:- start:529 stop:864 length:336 start_codon:yes stop_codon:yes gene_type:complete
MGRIKKGKCWRVRFYDNRAREGDPIKDYLCRSVIEITQKTGMARGHIFQIKDKRIEKCYYKIDIVDTPIVKDHSVSESPMPLALDPGGDPKARVKKENVEKQKPIIIINTN